MPEACPWGRARPSVRPRLARTSRPTPYDHPSGPPGDPMRLGCAMERHAQEGREKRLVHLKSPKTTDDERTQLDWLLIFLLFPFPKPLSFLFLISFVLQGFLRACVCVNACQSTTTVLLCCCFHLFVFLPPTTITYPSHYPPPSLLHNKKKSHTHTHTLSILYNKNHITCASPLPYFFLPEV